ncbi:MAG: hypothetical protein ACFFBD_30455, partial [Candidatus Hodarchaeota archaeon]
MDEMNIQDQKGRPGVLSRGDESSFLDRSIERVELFYDSRGRKGIPIIEEEGKFRFKLLFAFPFSIVLSLGVIVLGVLLGAEYNPFLAQIEMFVLFFTLTSTGWLTRSKLKSLLIIVTWPVVYLVCWTLRIYHPYGLLPRIIENAWSIVEELPQYLGVAFTQIPAGFSPSFMGALVDLILLFFGLFFIGAILIAVISTGFWTEFGDLSVVSIIFKPLCAIVLIILLTVVPLSYHATTALANGGVEFGSGVVDIIQTIDLQNPYEILNITDPIERDAVQTNFTRASDHFWNSRTYFIQFRGNFLLGLIIAVVPINIPIEGFGTISNTEIADVTSIMTNVAGGARYFTRAAPKIIFGITDLYRGFSEIIGLDLGLPVSKQVDIGSITDNETILEEGLIKIQSGINYFQEAKNDLGLGLEEIFSIITTQAFNNTIQNVESGEQISELVIGYGAGIPALIDAANGTVPLVRALWNVFTAATLIARSEFENATQKLDVAEEGFQNASAIFNVITPDPLCHDDIKGVINILKDMLALILPFVGGGKSALAALDSVQQIVNSYMTFSNTTLQDPMDPWWSTNDQLVDKAANNITEAITDANNGSDMMDLILLRANNSYYGVLSPQMGQIVGQIHNIMNTSVLANITGLNHLVECFKYAYDALWASSFGLNAVAQAGLDPNNATHVAQYLPEPAQSYFQWVVNNCTLGKQELDQASGIDASTLTLLGDALNILNSSASLARDACASGNATSPEFQFLLEALNNIQDVFSGIFGGGGGTQKQRIA